MGWRWPWRRREPQDRGVGQRCRRSGAVSAVNTRLERLTATGDSSVVLNPIALDEGRRLWAATMVGNPPSIPIDVVTALARLHWGRCQALMATDPTPDADAPESQLLELSYKWR